MRRPGQHEASPTAKGLRPLDRQMVKPPASGLRTVLQDGLPPTGSTPAKLFSLGLGLRLDLDELFRVDHGQLARHAADKPGKPGLSPNL